MSKYTEAKKKNNQKWDAVNLKRGGYAMRIELYEAFEKYCMDHDISKNALINEAVTRYIDFVPVGNVSKD